MAGIETIVGSQFPLDAASIANMLAQNRLTGRGQDLDARGQDLTARGQDIQTRQQDIQVAIAQAEFNQRGQEALQQYEIDVANFGLDKAREMYNQRLQRAQMQLAASSEGSNQRATAAGLKLDTLKTLNSMRGPQDWVGYNNTLNALAAPTGELVDPTTWTDEIVDPMFRPGGAGLDLSSFDDAIANTDSLQGPKRVLTGQGAQINTAGIGNVGAWTSPWGSADGFLNTAGMGGGGGGGAAPLQYQNPYPKTGSGTAMDPYSQPTGNQGVSAYSGVPNEAVAAAQLKQGGTGFFTTGDAGTSNVDDYVGYDVYRSPSAKFNKGETIAPGTPLWLRKLNEGGFVNDQAAIVGEGASAEDLGSNGEILLNPSGADIAILSNEEAKKFIREAMNVRKEAEKGKRRGYNPKDPKNFEKRSVEEQLKNPKPKGKVLKRYGVDSENPPRGVGYNKPQQGPRKPFEGLRDLGRDSGLPKHAAGTVTDQGWYGGGADPNLLRFLQYSPDTLGSMPVMDTLKTGQKRGGRIFGGFGAKLSNPALGIQDAPTNLNLQGLRDMDVSERDMTAGLYEQGLHVDFRDLLERARRAAPIGTAAGVKRYGR